MNKHDWQAEQERQWQVESELFELWKECAKQWKQGKSELAYPKLPILERVYHEAEDHALYGWIAYAVGSVEEALDYLLRAHEQKPDHVDYILTIGEYLEKMGRRPESLTYYKK